MRKVLQQILNRDCTFGRHARVSLLCQIHSSCVKDYARVAKFSTVRNTNIGRFSSIGENTRVRNSNIGSFCAISWNVTINAIAHPLDLLTVSAFPYFPDLGRFVSKDGRKIPTCIVGNDVWIGANAVVMPGVSISDGAVIGAGAVVTKDVGAYEVHAGVPANFVRHRFSSELIEKLRSLPWWELETDVIAANLDLFSRRVDPDTIERLDKLITERKSRA